MQKYKDLNNNVHDIDNAFEHLLPVGSVKITDAQATVLLKPPPETPQEASDRKDAQIEIEFTPALLALVKALDPANATTIIATAKANRKAEL